MQKRGLGRGLEALIPDAGDGGSLQPLEVPVADIVPNALQPRQRFDGERMEELARSIREHGVVQPVLVRRRGEKYELIAGERRWRAAQAAGLTTIPAVVKEIGDREMVEVALIENLQREDLNPIEEAEAFSRLAREFGLTQEETAARVGKSRAHITNMIRLLQLDESVQAMVREGLLSMGHARAILALPRQDQARAARAVVDGGLSVRQTEALVKRMAGPARKRKDEAERREERVRPAELEEAEAQLMEALGTRVRIEGSDQKGRIEIAFFSREDLERILGIILAGGRDSAGSMRGGWAEVGR